jgi:phenylalanyl-tRNA synthetase alpha chain
MFIGEQIEKKEIELEEKKYEQIADKEAIDVTAEFPSKNLGHKHPISITSNLLEEIFISL